MTVRASTNAKRKLRVRRARPHSAAIGIRRVYDKPSPDDGMRILVDRLWPRGLSKASFKYDAWPRELAPSNHLRKWYGHDPKRFAEFRRRYRDELAAHRDDLEALRVKFKGRNATLLTATREIDLSDAMVLRDMLKKRASK